MLDCNVSSCEACGQSEKCQKDNALILEVIEKNLIADKEGFLKVVGSAKRIADSYGVSVENFVSIILFNEFIGRIISKRAQNEMIKEMILKDLPPKEELN